MVTPLATRRPDPRHIGTPLPAPLLCSAAPRVEAERTGVRPIEGHSCPSPGHPRLVTPTESPHVARRGRRDDRCSGRAGRRGPGHRHPRQPRVQPVRPARPCPRTVAPAHAHWPRCPWTAGAAAGPGRFHASQLAAGVSPVTATGRAILASGLAAGATLDGTAKHLMRPRRPRRGTGSIWPAPGTPGCARHPPCTGGSAPPSSAGAARGIPRAARTNAAYIVVKHESGANPHAYNGWDSNAAAGHPSEGIAQVIGPTFRAYALGGHHNIWNPVDNMITGLPLRDEPVRLHEQHSRSRDLRQGGSYVGY